MQQSLKIMVSLKNEHANTATELQKLCKVNGCDSKQITPNNFIITSDDPVNFFNLGKNWNHNLFKIGRVI